MTYLFEFDPPCRLRPKIERIGVMTRIIWLWWSVAFIRRGFNDLLRHERAEGYQRWKDKHAALQEPDVKQLLAELDAGNVDLSGLADAVPDDIANAPRQTAERSGVSLDAVVGGSSV